MTKQEAIEAMQKGERLTHPFFRPHEFVYMKEDGFVYTEDGFCDKYFWAIRKDKGWQQDWKYYISEIRGEFS